jgi:hypothetical protein
MFSKITPEVIFFCVFTFTHSFVVGVCHFCSLSCVKAFFKKSNKTNKRESERKLRECEAYDW